MNQELKTNQSSADDGAFEYVLGSLDRERRDQLTRQRLVDVDLDRNIFNWEAHLQGLADSQKPVEPDAAVRDQLMQRLFDKPLKTAPGGMWQSLGLWRGFTAFASLASFILVFVLVSGTGQQGMDQPTIEADYCAWFSKDQQVAWMLWANSKTGQMKTSVMMQPTLAKDESMELWMIPKDGSAPVSLGLLPTEGEATLLLPAGTVENSKALAVSQEPLGGSPTGAPTGPVVYQSKWWRVG